MRWAPSRLAAVWARKSPEISRVPRKFERIIAKRSRSICPPFTKRTGGITSPSW